MIWVLVGGAGLPAATELPDDLQGLVRRQAVVLHDETWHQDVEGLLRSLRGQPAAAPGRRRRWLVPAGAAAALVVLLGLGAVAGWWGPGRSGSGAGDEAGSETGILSCAPPEGQGWSPIALGGDPTGEEKLENGSLIFGVKEAYRRGGEGNWFAPTPDLVTSQTTGDALIGFEVTCDPAGYIELILENDSDRISVTDDTLEPGAC